jgi:putative CocE/NonD family hydrolase
MGAASPVKTTVLRSLRCALVLSATAVGAWNLARASAQSSVETITWIFAGDPVGSNTYRTLPNGRFESTSEEKVRNVTIISKLTGTVANGLLTEYELVNNEGGREVKVTAKQGKAHITKQGKTSEVAFTPAKAVFANEHPFLTETMLRAIDPNKEGAQFIDVLLLDQAIPARVELRKKGRQTIERSGSKTIINHYLFYVAMVLSDLYVTEDGRFVSMDTPLQDWRATRTGYEAVIDALISDPASRYPELSPPTMKTTVVKGVRMKMRDGTELVADIFRPADDERHPAILRRTPYGRDSLPPGEGEYWASRGYVLIVQDVRGRNDSQGQWTPWAHERKDGYDTIDWIAQQPWSNRKVGMIGGSYGGMVQWAAAAEAHSALKCIVPEVSPPDPFFDIPFDHGVPALLASLFWADYVREKRVRGQLQPSGDFEKLVTLPLSRIDNEVLGRDIPFFDDWWTKETASAFDGGFMNDLGKIRIPVLHISGWWDGDGIGTKLNWAKLREAKHPSQWLIYGPWEHQFNSSTSYRDVDYGADAIMDLDSLYLRWFDTWLKDKDVAWDKQPHVRVFVTDANEWRELNDWPDPTSEQLTFYLSSAGRANGSASRGKLLTAPPKSEPPDRYVYDPEKVEASEESDSTIVKIPAGKEDLLVYRTEPLNEALDIAGPIELELYFSTNVKDTDFFASLVAVDEMGRMRLIGQPGKIRARYLSGWDTPTLLQPGKTYKAVFPLWDLAHRVRKGQRLGLIIESEMFPHYARNLNTGESNATATRMVVATQTIYHDAGRPSALRLRRLK